MWPYERGVRQYHRLFHQRVRVARGVPQHYNYDHGRYDNDGNNDHHARSRRYYDDHGRADDLKLDEHLIDQYDDDDYHHHDDQFDQHDHLAGLDRQRMSGYGRLRAIRPQWDRV